MYARNEAESQAKAWATMRGYVTSSPLPGIQSVPPHDLKAYDVLALEYESLRFNEK
jgi:hypothetical protein